MQSKHYNIILASSGGSLKLLRSEFPDLLTLELPDYDLKFSTRIPIGVSAAMQGLKLNKKIKEEFAMTQQLIAQHNIDGIISDNRYGVYSKQLPSVLITHQLKLAPKTPFGIFANSKIKSYINRFDNVWIPDFKGSVLTGDLSTIQTTIPKTYIGTLSRFDYETEHKREGFILVTLSGTEPQRTQLEDKIIDWFGDTSFSVKLYRGKPLDLDSRAFPKNFKVHSHASTKELELDMRSCRLLISRCGYSTIMDIIAAQTPAVLRDTPTQTEQEYIGDRLRNQYGLMVIKEREFTLEMLEKAKPLNLHQTDSFEKTLLTWAEGL